MNISDSDYRRKKLLGVKQKMATLTIRLPNEKHIRLKELAQTRGTSVNKLIEELSTIALAEFDSYTRFKARAVTGNPEAGLRILDKLDNLTE